MHFPRQESERLDEASEVLPGPTRMSLRVPPTGNCPQSGTHAKGRTAVACRRRGEKWVRLDSNQGPRPYQGRTLTN